MMKVTVIQKFHDKADYDLVYLVGETVVFDDARAEELISKGLVESAEEPQPVVVEEPVVAEEPVEVKPVAVKRRNAKEN